MPLALTRRHFVKSASLLPLCAAAGGPLARSALAAGPAPVSAAPAGAKLKLSLNAFCFNDLLLAGVSGKSPGLSLFDVLEFCARHDFEAIDPTGYYFPGYPGVPTDDFINEFKRRAFRLGLDISGTGIRNDFAQPDDAKRADDVRRAQTWIEVAAKLGAPVIRVFAGAVPKGYENDWDTPAKWMVECLQECIEHGKKFGVLVGVQNHGDMLKNADQCLAIVQRVASPWFGLIVDTGNMMVPHPYADLARVVPHAMNWQVKESPRGPDSAERTDLPRLIRILKAAGYRGYIPIETLAPHGRPYDPFAIVPPFAAQVRAAMAAA